jgi:hypothetical protein
MRGAAVSLLAFAALAPRSAWAHCSLQYQVIGPGGLFYQSGLGPVQNLGILPGGTTGQLGADVSWTDRRYLDLSGTILVTLTATDLTGSVTCPTVSLNLDGPPSCSDDFSPEGFPPCTPSFTVTQTAPHAFSCSSACVSYPQPHTWLANYYLGNAPAPLVSSLSPQSTNAGAPSLAVDIHGSGFVGSSQVQINGSALTTVFVDNSDLLALIPSSLLSTSGTSTVTVLNPGGTSSPAPFVISAPNPGSISQAPSGLAGVALGISSISWTWNAAAGAASYNFYPPSGAIAVPIAGTSFVQTGLSPNIAYSARVSASNGSGEGPSSDPASAYTWAAPATALTLVQAGNVSLTVSWSAGANPASTTRYRLDYWPTAGSTNSLITVLTQASATGLSPTTTYYLTVTALNGGGVAAPSGIILSVMTGVATGTSENQVVGSTGGTVSFASPSGLVTASIPLGAFTTSVNITLSVPTGFPGGAGSSGNLMGTGVGVQFILTPPVQPLVKMKITVPYRLSDVTGMDQRTLVLARYDDAQNVWVPLVSSVDTLNRTVTAQTDHLSTFQIMQAAPSGTVSTAKAFPNPLRPSMGQTFMTFEALPASARVRIYDLKGVLVKDMTANASGMANWDGTNQSGAAAASGVYFMFAQGAGQSRTLAVAVQR